jgi:hypothetical protein
MSYRPSPSWRNLTIAVVAIVVACGLGLIIPGVARGAHAALKPLSIIVCQQLDACQTVENEGTGSAISGEAQSNHGIVGITHYDSTNAPRGRAGVLGRDDSPGTGYLNAGVRGIARNGSGLSGISTTGDGIDALSNGHWGGNFQSQTYGGVYASSKAGVGIVAENWSSTWPTITMRNYVTGFEMTAIGPGGSNVMSLDTAGNMILAGTVTQNGTPQSVRKTSRGIAVTTYSAQQVSRTVEDVGRAQLVNGYAIVTIGAAFSAAAASSDYLVFITPEGDCKGLFVSERHAHQFVVRESQGGRSSLLFTYRVIGKT